MTVNLLQGARKRAPPVAVIQHIDPVITIVVKVLAVMDGLLAHPDRPINSVRSISITNKITIIMTQTCAGRGRIPAFNSR
jgi:hypothetical protein